MSARITDHVTCLITCSTRHVLVLGKKNTLSVFIHIHCLLLRFFLRENIYICYCIKDNEFQFQFKRLYSIISTLFIDVFFYWRGLCTFSAMLLRSLPHEPQRKNFNVHRISFFKMKWRTLYTQKMNSLWYDLHKN